MCELEQLRNQNWTPTERQLPPDGVEVDTMDSGGRVQSLRRFWLPDDSMYVYYVPKFWKLTDNSKGGE